MHDIGSESQFTNWTACLRARLSAMLAQQQPQKSVRFSMRIVNNPANLWIIARPAFINHEMRSVA
jgi:hypothetical protein